LTVNLGMDYCILNFWSNKKQIKESSPKLGELLYFYYIYNKTSYIK
jgi:hypothetical protein